MHGEQKQNEASVWMLKNIHNRKKVKMSHCALGTTETCPFILVSS